MAIGYLTVQAWIANGARPVAGVRVRVMDDQGRRLYSMTTNENGETPLVSLETVDASLSRNPGYVGTPYVSYQVYAQAEGFEPLLAEGIPIYEGETAVLPMQLIPLQAMQPREGGVETIASEEPAVAHGGSGQQQGPAIAPIVLRQVVIPKTITVHLGSPSSPAANVRVSFPDYVKNAASSEIYPTWPDAALRANIYAIITFALNRIYTEWYRGQGYDFDITGSTAYDQAFVYGRATYESINKIVDEIFDHYIRRAGQYAPYFTAFCNGTTVTCTGLSQWGTVTLANQGYTPIEILRAYYPDDIEIAQAQAVADTAGSYPGTPLRVGSAGLDVQTVQTYLNRIRRNYPGIPAITDPDGVFGASTREAVRKFQSIFNLSADGVVGKATWYQLSRIYTAVTRLAELDSEGTSLGIGTVPPSAVLRQGSRGNDVLTLQYLLNLVSEYYPGFWGVAQDGIFGADTRRAVVAFQQAQSLNPDGIVGPATWQALYDVYLGIQGIRPPAEPDDGYFTYTVRSGDTLWLLARRYGTTVDEIRRLNGLTGDMLRIGQVLRIPG